MKKKVALAVLAALFVTTFLVSFLAMRSRQRRRLLFPTREAISASVATDTSPADAANPAVWTDRFVALQNAGEWADLQDLLESIRSAQPQLYESNQLRYLHARAALEADDLDEARELMAPFLAKGHDLREVALYHAAVIEDEDGEAAKAWTLRNTLLREHSGSPYESHAIDDQLQAVDAEEKPDIKLQRLADLPASVWSTRRRELLARKAEALARAGRNGEALPIAAGLLQQSTDDDAGDRTARILDAPAFLPKLSAPQLEQVGEALRTHRHYDRAVAVLTLARSRLPARGDDLTFAIGRSYFGAEKFKEAQATYASGAASTKDPKWRSTFFYHAARSAQLLGDDGAGERFLTGAIAVPGNFPSTSAALTQRIRTRLKQNRIAQADSDLALLRKSFPNEHGLVEASIACAIAAIARGDGVRAIVYLNSIPRAILDKYDPSEISYWKGRALEKPQPGAAAQQYLATLRADVPSHFSYFARKRLAAPEMARTVQQEMASKRAAAGKLIAEGKHDEARKLLTDVVLLAAERNAADLQKLGETYRQTTPYQNIIDLETGAFPKLPLPDASRDERLMAMGLFDDAVGSVSRRHELKPMSSGVTRALAYRWGNASKESILAIEIVARELPDDYVPELLPRTMRELLYPRYFYSFIVADAEKHDADPQLVLSIMREESRFNPRAKSMAAARGLLQFIITTARQVGRDLGIVDIDPQDLYDPRIIIQLGAKYIGSLLEEFEGNRYKAAAAYNAGPFQTRLWSRLAPAPGDDFFLSSINFDETKHYVRKVMNSYERYGEIYGNKPPAGGTRAVP